MRKPMERRSITQRATARRRLRALHKTPKNAGMKRRHLPALRGAFAGWIIRLRACNNSSDATATECEFCRASRPWVPLLQGHVLDGGGRPFP